MSRMPIIRGTLVFAVIVVAAGAARSEMWNYSASIQTGYLDPTGRFAEIHSGIIHWDDPAIVPN
jgi:hypothetical protein